MAKLYDVAKDLKDVVEEGIGWLVVWKEGNGWRGAAIWPDYDEESDTMTLQPGERQMLQEIIDTDPGAILVNPWAHNLGVKDYWVSANSLESALRWHYMHQTSLASDHI